MAGYIGSRASVVSSGAERKKTFDITTTTTVLTGVSYTPTFVHLFHNGVRLVDGTDYTATNGTSITLTTAAQSGDQVVVVSYATFQPSDTVSASAGGTFAGDVSVTGAFTSLGIDDNATSVAITIDASENVGIGTASPSANLSIVGAGNGTSFSNTTASTAYNWAEVVGNAGGSVKIGVDNNIGTAFNSGNYGGSIQSTNNLAFSAGGAERMRIDSAGRVTTPYQPMFHALRTTHVTTSGDIAFQQVNRNVGGHYNSSNGRFTVPIAGNYLFCFSALLYAMGNSSNAQLQLNGGGLYSMNSLGTYGEFTGSYAGQGGSTIVHLNAGDYVAMNFSYAGTNLHAGFTFWSGQLIG